MARIQPLMASGTPPLQAVNIVGDVSASLTATGSTQATALLLGSANNLVGVCTTSKGVQLPVSAPGDAIYVYNQGAQTCSVYGQTGESIGAGSANAAFSVATNKGAVFVKMSNTFWAPDLTA